MTDILIRDVPDEVVSVLDARAEQLGLSRSEFLRRRLAQEPAVRPARVTVEDIAFFAETFADLADEEVRRAAWR